MDPPEVGDAAAHGGHARRGRGEDEGQQSHGERERPEEVAAELKLETVGRRHPGGRRHHSGVVDQHIDRRAVRQQAVSELLHRRQVGEVNPPYLKLRVRVVSENLVPRLLAFRWRPDGHDDAGARGPEAARGLLADAAVRARHDDELPGLARDGIHR